MNATPTARCRCSPRELFQQAQATAGLDSPEYRQARALIPERGETAGWTAWPSSTSWMAGSGDKGICRGWSTRCWVTRCLLAVHDALRGGGLSAPPGVCPWVWSPDCRWGSRWPAPLGAIPRCWQGHACRLLRACCPAVLQGQSQRQVARRRHSTCVPAGRPWAPGMGGWLAPASEAHLVSRVSQMITVAPGPQP